MVDKCTAAIAVKLPKGKRQAAVNILESFKSPGVGLGKEREYRQIQPEATSVAVRVRIY
ncbi:MAG: hypothetical protein LBD93_03105 [Treponema sp.]|jgi:hypothetical protein|nr:hypothetical protein [Treponema sp.]